jgi:hypothetical protein
MAIRLDEATATIISEGFRLNDSTKKSAEFQSLTNGRVLYLRLDQGFPDHADVVVHPDVDAAALLAVPEVEANKRVTFRFGGNMSQFPKRLNGRRKPEHYGRALYAYSVSALAKLCREYGR